MEAETREASSAEFVKSRSMVQRMSGKMGFDENIGNVNWRAVRIVSSLGYRLMPKDKGARFQAGKIGGTNVICIEPKEKKNDAVILYIHGGGFVSGSAAGAKGYGSMVANYTGSLVVAPNYSLCPEHVFPRALNDCCAVYKGLLDSGRTRIALLGESAGGNLCLATALKARDNSWASPLCVIVHSPFTDFYGSIDRHAHEIADCTVKESCLAPLGPLYAPHEDLRNPYISPLYANYAGFPPVFVTCDYNETLFADSYALYEACRKSNVSGKLVIMKNAYHAFATLGTGSPETLAILNETAAFIHSLL